MFDFSYCYDVVIKVGYAPTSHTWLAMLFLWDSLVVGCICILGLPRIVVAGRAMLLVGLIVFWQSLSQRDLLVAGLPVRL